MKFNTRPVRIPPEFDDFVEDLKNQLRKDTGLAYTKAATMRQLAKMKGILVVKNGKIDWRLI